SDGPPLMILGALGVTVFRIWGTIDAFSGPSGHNRRVRELKYRLGIPVRVGRIHREFGDRRAAAHRCDVGAVEVTEHAGARRIPTAGDAHQVVRDAWHVGRGDVVLVVRRR